MKPEGDTMQGHSVPYGLGFTVAFILMLFPTISINKCHSFVLVIA